MDGSRAAVVRVGFVPPVVLLRHVVAPNGARAGAEVEGMSTHLRDGGRAVLVYIDRAIPPPSFTALSHFRRFIERERALECIALVAPAGLGSAVANGVVERLVKFTRLAGRLGTFNELDSACAWLAASSSEAVDAGPIGEALTALLELE
ncbi:MAG: hypothetical protein KC457_32125 [Myxococcales bacterium]|nr:hypothetical protein [Myxococcales bacterium]